MPFCLLRLFLDFAVIIYIGYNFTRIYFVFFQWILIRYTRSCSRYSSKAKVRLGLGETWQHSGCILHRSVGILTVLVHQGACLMCVSFTFHAFCPPQNGLCALNCKWNSKTLEMTILFLFFSFVDESRKYELFPIFVGWVTGQRGRLKDWEEGQSLGSSDKGPPVHTLSCLCRVDGVVFCHVNIERAVIACWSTWLPISAPVEILVMY